MPGPSQEVLHFARTLHMLVGEEVISGDDFALHSWEELDGVVREKLIRVATALIPKTRLERDSRAAEHIAISEAIKLLDHGAAELRLLRDQHFPTPDPTLKTQRLRVEVEYYKPSGKYYTSDVWTVEGSLLEIRELFLKQNPLPGLTSARWEGFARLDPGDFPRLIHMGLA